MKNNYIEKSLDAYSNEVEKRYHMPGHKAAFAWEPLENALKYDVTEVDGTDNLMHPEGAIKLFMDEMTGFYKTKRTYISVNGSTGALMAAISTVCDRGDKVIVQRDAHKSIYNAIGLLDLKTTYVYPKIDSNWRVPMGVDVEEISSAIKSNIEAKALILTHPNYYGFGQNLDEIVKLAHEAGLYVIIDEAHGAHLPFYEQENIKSALDSNADLVVQSYHKTLPALTQTAVLHLNTDKIDHKKLEKKLFTFQTTSPSYLLMNSMEYAFEFMRDDGAELLEILGDKIDSLSERLQKIDGCEIYNIKSTNKNIENTKDFTKLLISVEGYSGYELEKILRNNYKIQVEMADFKCVVLILTVADTISDLERFYEIVEKICKDRPEHSVIKNIACNVRPEVKMTVAEAFSAACKNVRLKKASGEIAANFVIPYPPGTPIVVPGELIDDEVICCIEHLIEAGHEILGVDDGYIDIIIERM
ncbi:MAG: aminotransferase class I/II-fold pyridoxal phosphate-dependent enzyme [Tissierellales bacterium]|jgi:lysine decarboxylase|nr:aminotransferase class I/II-fold pyridoxal phosphate-dependent enzyme [Tissierellales bacterium]